METERKADFRACPILADYLATMLQDLQFTESDEACTDEREARDSGTIYELNESDYQRCKADCEAFMVDNAADIESALDLVPGEDGLRSTADRYMTHERIGSTLYMVRVGHGVSFTDDGDADCLQRLNAAARAMAYFEGAYFGDDGKVYLA